MLVHPLLPAWPFGQPGLFFIGFLIPQDANQDAQTIKAIVSCAEPPSLQYASSTGRQSFLGSTLESVPVLIVCLEFTRKQPLFLSNAPAAAPLGPLSAGCQPNPPLLPPPLLWPASPATRALTTPLSSPAAADLLASPPSYPQLPLKPTTDPAGPLRPASPPTTQLAPLALLLPLTAIAAITPPSSNSLQALSYCLVTQSLAAASQPSPAAADLLKPASPSATGPLGPPLSPYRHHSNHAVLI
ncbi:hypothetical protein PCANC_13398 [Puccinia coronata f. sp. avenae]|uniref:Uncharacterized protein n=1 Tax=Puccinia coronata f. sp. avenae TaxID=200324 RepID=A0A2N5VTN5_9BASI|nr:hypothetical protein PCANC_13398 [Puccinia coronata f. sp. avenae]